MEFLEPVVNSTFLVKFTMGRNPLSLGKKRRLETPGIILPRFAETNEASYQKAKKHGQQAAVKIPRKKTHKELIYKKLPLMKPETATCPGGNKIICSFRLSFQSRRSVQLSKTE